MMNFSNLKVTIICEELRKFIFGILILILKQGIMRTLNLYFLRDYVILETLLAFNVKLKVTT